MTASEPETGLSPAAEKIVRDIIHPIVEFFPVDLECRNDSEFINTSNEDRKNLRKMLSKSKGIYSFYNSEYECVYVGKTKNNLWTEMKSAFNRPMPHYGKYTVSHPEKYKAPTRLRKITKQNVYLYDTATYFSAYNIEDSNMIDIIEMMIIRIMPNDLLNVRMEGNMSLFALGVKDAD